MSEAGDGVCVVCEKRGFVGQPCTTPACHRRNYWPIPIEYAPGDQGASDVRIGQKWGDYLIVERLGVGGVGTVYLALQPPIMLQAALKVLSPGTARPFVDRFRQEAMALARLNHPNIVRMLHFGEHRGSPYLVMEYVPGGRTLRSVDRAKLLMADCFTILGQLCDALEAAHLVGVVHRDVKPGNVMLQSLPSQPCFVRLVDFGLAKLAETGHSTGLLAGTPTYMAPEQLTQKGIGPWTDWYAFGVVAFEMLTGTLPYPCDSTAELVRYKTLQDFHPLATGDAASLPTEIRTLLAELLTHDVAQRLKSSTEIRRRLAAAAAEFTLESIVPQGGGNISRRTAELDDEIPPTMPSRAFHPHLPRGADQWRPLQDDTRSGSSEMAVTNEPHSASDDVEELAPDPVIARGDSNIAPGGKATTRSSKPPYWLGVGSIFVLAACLGWLSWFLLVAHEPTFGEEIATGEHTTRPERIAKQDAHIAELHLPDRSFTHSADFGHPTRDAELDVSQNDYDLLDSTTSAEVDMGAAPREIQRIVGKVSDKPKVRHRQARGSQARREEPREHSVKRSTRRESVDSSTTSLDGEAILYQAAAAVNQRRLADAERLYLKVTRFSSLRAQAYRGLAIVKEQERELDHALSYIERALRLAPTHANSHHMKARLHLEKKEYRKACESWQVAIQHEPDHKAARDGLSTNCGW